jgi:hypothetical protein
MIIPAETTALVIVFGFVIRWVRIEKTLWAVILVYQLYAVLILDNDILEPFRCRIDKREILPHGVRLTAKAVNAGSIAVADEGIIIGRPPNIREDGLIVQHILHILKIQPGVQHELQLGFQFIGVFSNAAIQIDQIAVEVVVDLKILSGVLMKQNPSTTSKYLNVAFIIQREPRDDFVPEGFFAADPGHETIDSISPLQVIGGHPISDRTPGLDLVLQLTDCLFAGRYPLELVAAQADCGKAHAEQESDSQPQRFHYPITIPSSKSSHGSSTEVILTYSPTMPRAS